MHVLNKYPFIYNITKIKAIIVVQKIYVFPFIYLLYLKK